MDTDELTLLFELYENTPRQGPGSVATTRRAMRMLPGGLRIERVLDLGCGTGGSTIVLAEETGAKIVAVDIHAPFLATLEAKARARRLDAHITPVVADMAGPPFAGDGVDLVWAEGSAYSIGFEKALRRWRPLVRQAGCLVVSELVWFGDQPAEEARVFFANEYPDMQDEVTRIEQARRAGYSVLGSFRLPREDWRAYYAGLESPLREATERHGERAIYTATRREAEIYERHGEDYGYVCLALQNGEDGSVVRSARSRSARRAR